MMRPNTQTVKCLFLLLIVVMPLSFLGLANHGLWSADEPRVAEIGREMALTGNWAVPTLNQKPFLEEPPLYYATLALTFKAFGGASDKVARIPSALFGFATIIVLFFMVNELLGPKVALISGFILATAGEYFRVAHWIVVDSALTFFVVSAMALFITGYLSEESRRKLLFYTLLYVASTLAFYTKGFIGIVLPGLSILAFLVVERNVREILKMRLWLGVMIFLAMTLPWFIALWHQGGTEHLNVFLVHNHLQRFLPGSHSGNPSGHHHPFYYYLTEFPNGFLPWSILLVPVLYHAFSRTAQPDEAQSVSRKGRLFATCWFFAGIIFLSVASTKRTLYLMPIFAPISMLTASYVASTLRAPRLDRIGTIFLWVFDLVLLVLGLGMLPAYFYLKSAYPLSTTLGFSMSVAAISVLVTAMTIAGTVFLRRKNLTWYWTSLSLSIVFLLIFTLVGIVPLLDKHKSFVPFCTQITALVSADQPLYGYKPDETLRGAVPFYTKRFVIETEELGKDILQEKEPFFMMIRDRKGAVEKELLSKGALRVLVKQTMGTDRMLVLLTNRPVGEPVILGDSFEKHRINFERSSLKGAENTSSDDQDD